MLPIFLLITTALAAPHASKTTLLKNYIALWNGQSSLLNTTLSPSVTLHMDRLVIDGKPLEDVHGAEAFAQNIGFARSGWESYQFEIEHMVHDEHFGAIRWNMHGIASDNIGRNSTLKAGDKLTYSGTDFLTFDCNLISSVKIAQDSLDFWHKMGLQSVSTA